MPVRRTEGGHVNRAYSFTADLERAGSINYKLC